MSALPRLVYVLVFTMMNHGAPTMTSYDSRGDCHEALKAVIAYGQTYRHECYAVVVMPPAPR